MAYATKQDIVDIYGGDLLELVATPRNSRVVDDNRVNRALSQASSEVDARISGRYVTPIAAPTDQVKQIVIDMAIYRMAIGLDVQTDEFRRRYDDAIKYLEAAGTGKGGVGLGLEEEDAESVGSGSRAITSGFLFRA